MARAFRRVGDDRCACSGAGALEVGEREGCAEGRAVAAAHDAADEFVVCSQIGAGRDEGVAFKADADQSAGEGTARTHALEHLLAKIAALL